MARQAGPLFITGTIDDLVFYKLGDNYYVRSKGEPTSTTKKRLKHDKGYALLQLKRSEFGRASELVKSMYYTLPLEVRKQGLFGTLTGKAVRWLRQGKSEEEIIVLLRKVAQPVKECSEQPITNMATAAKNQEPEKSNLQKPAGNSALKAVGAPELSQWNVTVNGRMNSLYTAKHVPSSMPSSPLSLINEALVLPVATQPPG
jgi:hypothetical protein